MSDGQKKSGLRDISDLKARLGMLNRNVGGKAPVDPTPQPSVDDLADSTFTDAPEDQAAIQSAFAPATLDLATDPRAEIDEPTAVVSVDPGMHDQGAWAAPDAPATQPWSVEPEPTPIAAPAPAPAPPSGSPGFSPFDIGSAAELFRQPEPPADEPTDQRGDAAQRITENWAPEEPSSRATENWSPSAQAEAAFADAPADEPVAKLAHPLHVGDYQKAIPSVDLSADEEASLAQFEGKQRGIKRSFALAAVAVSGIVALAFGFFIGDTRVTRRLVNAQIDQAIQVKDRLTPILDLFDDMAGIVEGMNPQKVEWEKVRSLPEELPAIEAGALLSVKPPLPEDLTGMLGTAVVDLKDFFQLVLRHRTSTLSRDKANLEAIENREDFYNNAYFAVRFEPVDPKTPPLKYIPPAGRIVAVRGKPRRNDKGDDNIIPVRTREGKDVDLALRKIIRLQREDVVASKGSVMDLYSRRVITLRSRVKAIRNYAIALRQRLDIEAARDHIMSF